MKETKRSGATWLDGFLVVAVAVLLCGVTILVVSSPMAWKWCLERLDARDWTHWTWTGVVTALVAVMAVIRYWPERRSQEAERDNLAALTPGPSPARGRGE